MKLRTRLDVFSTALLSALGATPLVACGGSAAFVTEPGGGSGGASIAGSASTAGAPTAGADSGSSGAAGAPGGAGAGSGENEYPCRNPKDLGNGLIECDGFRHRASAVTCASHVPRPEPVPNTGMLGSCTVDADCTDKPYGWCANGREVPGAYCNYGCINDEDCGSGALCECTEPVGRCVRADCASDADCTPGFNCRPYDASGGCDETTFSCQSPADTCGTDLDCGTAGQCRVDPASGHFQCIPGFCSIGRPFLIEGTQRLASAATRTDWSELARLPALTGLPEVLRARLAEQWTRVALMEHASIAAFARFTLQLMSLGAPASLIERATAAMVDETQHAKACFAVASGYAAMPLGPGRLAIERSLDESSLTEIVLNTIREGCVGETVAAIEAREAAERACDPAIRDLLIRISEDETRHAELGYRFVKWALAECGGGADLERAVRREFAGLLAEAPPSHGTLTAGDADLLRHGIVPPALRQAIRAQAIAEVIVPCSRSLFRTEARLSPLAHGSL